MEESKYVLDDSSLKADKKTSPLLEELDNVRTALQTSLPNSDGTVDKELTENQLKLLYIVQVYSSVVDGGSDEETKWIHEFALMVLVFEAVEAQVLDYDTHPSWRTVGSDVVVMNSALEALADIALLCERRFVEVLSTTLDGGEGCQISYAATTTSSDVTNGMPSHMRNEVDSVIYAPSSGKSSTLKKNHLFRVHWDRSLGDFILKANDVGITLSSRVGILPTYSYICAPYIANHGRWRKRVKVSYDAVARQTANLIRKLKGSSATQIEEHLQLVDVIRAHDVKIQASVWLPIDSGDVIDLWARTNAQRGGAPLRFSSEKGSYGGGGLIMKKSTHIARIHSVLGHTFGEFVAFTALVSDEEADDKVATETTAVQHLEMGVTCSSSGVTTSGVRLQSAMDRYERDIPLDHVSSVQMDICKHIDRLATGCMLSNRKSDIVRTLWPCGLQSLPFSIITASALDPMFVARKYKDGGDFESKLEQILGKDIEVFDLEGKEILAVGDHALLAAGTRVSRYEAILMEFASLRTREKCAQNFRALLCSLRPGCEQSDKSWTMLDKVNDAHQHLSRCSRPPDVAGEAAVDRGEEEDAGTLKLRAILRIPQRQRSLSDHLASLEFLLHQKQAELERVRQRFGDRKDDQLNADRGTRNHLLSLSFSGVRAVQLLRILVIFLAGLLSFSLLDRLSTLYITPGSRNSTFANAFIAVSEIPGLWFGTNVLIWALVILLCLKHLRR